ncbi:hypothetical protein IWX92DRAFT_359395 [Phyllosticta citricarpa]
MIEWITKRPTTDKADSRRCERACVRACVRAWSILLGLLLLQLLHGWWLAVVDGRAVLKSLIFSFLFFFFFGEALLVAVWGVAG